MGQNSYDQHMNSSNYNGQRTRIKANRSNPGYGSGINEMDSIEGILFEAYNRNKFNEVRERASDILLNNRNKTISRLEAYTMAYNEIIDNNE